MRRTCIRAQTLDKAGHRAHLSGLNACIICAGCCSMECNCAEGLHFSAFHYFCVLIYHPPPSQFSLLETLIERYNTSTTEKLALLISQLQTMTSSVSELQAGVQGHSQQLSSLEAEVKAVVASLAEVRENVLQRIEELEGVTGRMVEEEDVVRIFGEELNKTVESRDSILWSWLTRVMILFMHDFFL